MRVFKTTRVAPKTSSSKLCRRSWLPFEKEIEEVERALAKLEAGGGPRRRDSQASQAGRLRCCVRSIRNLEPWETVLVTRHQERPQTVDYIDLIFEEFVELHGDRAFGNDRAMRTGFARLGDHRVMLIGHQKGHTLKERHGVLLRLRTPGRVPQGARAR